MPSPIDTERDAWISFAAASLQIVPFVEEHMGQLSTCSCLVETACQVADHMLREFKARYP